MDLDLSVALTVDQPWASLIAIGEKSIENRSWRPAERFIGMPLLIHAGRSYDHLGSFDLKVTQGIDCYAPHMPQRAIVAITRLADVITASDDPWFVGPYGWILDNVQAIAPVACSGNRGLWCPSKDVQQRVFAAAAESFDLDYYLAPPRTKSSQNPTYPLTI
ncbi:hypothetical protein [Deinococcus yunweiensis]|uniref:hypothetical protein n=1 Tax=Deinococcus yunweiensis TaxID=367282 RepID=UPI00398E47B8